MKPTSSELINYARNDYTHAQQARNPESAAEYLRNANTAALIVIAEELKRANDIQQSVLDSI